MYAAAFGFADVVGLLISAARNGTHILHIGKKIPYKSLLVALINEAPNRCLQKSLLCIPVIFYQGHRNTLIQAMQVSAQGIPQVHKLRKYW